MAKRTPSPGRSAPRLTQAMREALAAAGSIGGKARRARLTPERRQEIARKAVAAREAKRKKSSGP